MKIFFLLLMIIVSNSLMARGNKDKLFNLSAGANVGLSRINTEEDFRFFPNNGATGDNSLKSYNSGGDFFYGWVAVIENNIKWIPNYKFERWYLDTSDGEGASTQQFKNKQDMHYFWYSPVSTDLVFFDVGTIYSKNNFTMKSKEVPTGRDLQQDISINNYMAYFNLGFDIKGFIPSFSLGLPTSLNDTTSMFSVKFAYNFIRRPVDAQVYIGYDYFKYNFTDNTDLYGHSSMSRIYLGTTVGGGF